MNDAPASAPVPPAILAVIAAAIHCALAGRGRVIAVSTVLIDPDWAREGRRHIFSSHKVR